MTENDLTETTVEYYGRRICFESHPDLTATEYVQEVLEPMMIAMGFSPVSVYEATDNEEMLEVLKEYNYDR